MCLHGSQRRSRLSFLPHQNRSLSAITSQESDLLGGSAISSSNKLVLLLDFSKIQAAEVSADPARHRHRPGTWP